MVVKDKILREYLERSSNSLKLYERAVRVMPSGTTRDVIFYRPYPVYASKGYGSRIVDVNGVERIDFCFNYTALLLGHANQKVMKAIREQLNNGTLMGQPTELEVELAERINKLIPSAELIKFTVTGTEAVMNAIRVARAVTKRDKIVVFNGAYHGAYDSVVVDGTVAASSGMPKAVAGNTIISRYNDIEFLEKILKRNKRNVAAVILEPIQGAGGAIPADKEFLKASRELTTQYDILLIFDEIVTGFRVSEGGMQKILNITPDITTLGKVLGGGMPLSALTGLSEIMQKAFKHPEDGGGPRIPLSGTYNAHPVSLAAGIATLDQLNPCLYEHINHLGEKIRKDLQSLFNEFKLNAKITGAYSLFDIHIESRNSENLRWLFDIAMLNNGIYLAPSHFCCISEATTKDDVAFTIEKAGEALSIICDKI